MKRAGLVLIALGVASFASCSSNPEVEIILLDPCAESGTSFRDAAAYTEILVVENGCPEDPDLAAGAVESAVFQGVAEADKGLPKIGALEKGKYGFVALLKDANCGVIGFGCTAADLENIREVRIAVRAWTQADTCQPLTGGSCPLPLSCDEGRCVQEPGEGGAGGCDLSVVAGGPLPKLGVTGAQVTGPGVVATTSGFVIGYREYATSDGTMVANLVPLSDTGTLGTPFSVKVMDPTDAGQTPCPGKTVNDGVGMAYYDTQGLFVASLPDCGGGAGAAFVPFESSGSIGAWSAPRNPAFEDLTLGRGHSVAPATQSNEWEFVYRATTAGAPTIQRGIIQGNSFKNYPILTLFGAAPAAFGEVATGGTARGFLGGGVTSEAGTSTIVELSKIDAVNGDDATALGELTLPGASWATLTAWDDRVLAAVPATSGLLYSVAEVATASINPLVDQSALGGGSVIAADVVAHGDNLLFALAQAGQITVQRLQGAQGTIATSASDTQTLSGTIGKVSITNFDGTKMAMAADRDRVAVVWITTQQPGTSDPTGGWALLQCAE